MVQKSEIPYMIMIDQPRKGSNFCAFFFFFSFLKKDNSNVTDIKVRGSQIVMICTLVTLDDYFE